MHDLVIKGGNVVDGSGSEAAVADVAISDGVITEVGRVDGPASRTIDADGLVVTPGWVDMHTNYDAQVTWDPELTPSGAHGVTTVVMGNCGVGFAPARTADRGWLIGLMEGVEDIPGAALADGIEWEWETFPEYLDALDRRRWVCDVGTQIPHGALRAWVMGERAADGIEASPEDIEEMGRLTAEALAAGALGFSTSRTPLHKSIDGELVPGTSAATGELLGIAAAMGQVGHGVFECALHHPEVPESFGWMRAVAEHTRQPVLFNFSISDLAPDIWPTVLAESERAAADGLAVQGQVAGRPVGILQCWDGTVHPFIGRASFEALGELDPGERRKRLSDPTLRAQILSETADGLSGFVKWLTSSWDRTWIMSGDADYEPEAGDSLAAQAQRTGADPAALAYDHMCTADGRGILYFPFLNYSTGDLEPLRALHEHPTTLMGLSDGGAHCGAICDGGMPTFMISYWTRDRGRGPLMDLGRIVHRQTRQTALTYGLADRGLLAPGMRADVNVIDHSTLGVSAPHMAWDLPTGAPRFVQHAHGYRATVAAGAVTVEHDEFTGERPGRLLRGPTRSSVRLPPRAVE